MRKALQVVQRDVLDGVYRLGFDFRFVTEIIFMGKLFLIRRY